jgi:hypothetical protein
MTKYWCNYKYKNGYLKNNNKKHYLNKLINSVEQSPSWEGNSHSACQDTASLLWNPKVRYHIHKIPPLILNLGQMNPIHTFPSCFSKIYFNIILQSKPRSSKWSLPLKSSNQNSVCISHLPSAHYMPYTSLPPWFDHPNNIWGRAQIMKLLHYAIFSILLLHHPS